MAGDAAVFDGSVTLAFLTDPYDWARGAGYRIAREGSACHNWTGGQGPFRPGDTIDGATLDKSGELWRLTLPVGEDETMRPNRKVLRGRDALQRRRLGAKRPTLAVHHRQLTMAEPCPT